MFKKSRFIPFLSLFTAALLSVSCGGGFSPSAAADPESKAWAATELESAVISREWEQVKSALGFFAPAPNLRDLHAGDGALSLAVRIHGPMVVSILEAVGAEFEPPLSRDRLGDGHLAFAGGTFILEGRTLSLPGPLDRAPIDWPYSVSRVLVPAHSGILSMRPEKLTRVSGGLYSSVPIARLEDVSTFGENWTRERDIRPTGEVIEHGHGVPIPLASGGGAEAVARLAGQSPLIVRPEPDATVSDLVAFLDGAHSRERPGSLTFGVEIGEGPVRVMSVPAPDPTGPMITLKLDHRLPWAEVEPVLARLKPYTSTVLIMTLQDVSDPSALDLDGLPMGLPGGVLLPI